MRTHLVDLLVRQDKMTMAHGVETRVPFLGRQVIEFARALPAEHLVGPSSLTGTQATKVVVKELAQRSFGAAFTDRRKSAFNLPLAQYFRSAAFVTLMEDRSAAGHEVARHGRCQCRPPLVASRVVGAGHHGGILDPGRAGVMGAAVHRRSRTIAMIPPFGAGLAPGCRRSRSPTHE
jgi:hypothetical protein